MWTLGIGNMEQTKKLHGVVAWLLGGRAGGCKEGPGVDGMWWLGIKWSSNRAPSSIAILYGKIGAPFQLRLSSIWNR